MEQYVLYIVATLVSAYLAKYTGIASALKKKRDMGKYILYIGVALGLAYLANYTGIVEIPFLGKPYKPKESKPAPITSIEPGEKAIPDHRMIEPEKKSSSSSKDKSVRSENDEDTEVVYVKNNRNAHVIAGQVMIRVSDQTRDSACIEIMLPNMKVYRLPDMQIGARARFESNQKTYFLDLVEIYNKSAKIRITKRA
jgi:hypothetical protein